jgi:nucleotide-binding universal stress UspA family protein
VLVARAPSLTRTLVADDGSPGSAAAIEYLAAHPWLLGSSVCLVAVVHGDRPCGEPFELDIDPAAWPRIGAIRSERWASAAGRLSADADRLHAAGCPGGIEITTHEGLPGATLVALAERWRADLFVAGSRARPDGQRSPFGSVGRYVLHHAPCSVLLVPRSVAR